MVKCVVFFLFSLFTYVGWSQMVTLHGKVIDEEGRPILHARYYFLDTPQKKFKTDKNGAYTVNYKLGSNRVVLFDSYSFDSVLVTVTKRMERKLKGSDSLKLDIVLPYRTFNPIIVRPTEPDTLFGTQEYSVADFEFDQEGNVVLLTYEKTIEKGSVLRLLDTNNKVVDSYYVQGEAVELKTDFRKNIHLTTEERVFLVKIIENELFVYLEDRDYYFKYVDPIIDSIGSKIYFSNYSEVYPAFDYLEFDREDSTYNTILKVEDTTLMEFYRAEYKYVDVRTKLWAANKEIQTGIDKEIWVGATVFVNSIYYQPVYAPLFKVGADSIFVFDHYKDLMFKYTIEDGFVDSLRIDHHRDARKSGWEQPLIQDKGNGKIYSLFLRHGYSYLSEIDSKTGQVLKSFKLHFKYVDKIQIIDDEVFYVYRPYESIQRKYIYREKLSSEIN